MRRNWRVKQMIGGNCGSLLLLLTEALINKSCQRGDFTHASGTTKVKWRKKLDLPFELNWNDDISNLHMGGWSGLISPVGALLCAESAKKWLCLALLSSKFQNMFVWPFFIWSNKRCKMIVSLLTGPSSHSHPRLHQAAGDKFINSECLLTFKFLDFQFRAISNTWKLFVISF